jgi:DNA-binding transcriptional LysR family regulator
VLEDELGVRRYEKVGRKLQLTQGAGILLPRVKDLFVQCDSALAAIQEWKGMRRGTIRIGTGPLPAILKRFRRAHPGIAVLVETGNTPVLLGDLQKGSLSGEISTLLLKCRVGRLTNSWIEPSFVVERALLLTRSDPLN